MSAAIVQMEEAHKNTEPGSEEEIRLLGQMGVLCRILNRLDEAAGYLERAVALSEQAGNEKTRLVNSIRLAHVYQWQRRFDLSDPLFTEAIAKYKSRKELSGYLDYAHQHYAKSLFDQQRYTEAESHLRRAMQLRLAKGDTSLIASTWLALDATNRARDEEAGK